MQYPFDMIWKTIQSLPKPDRGDVESWKSWYAEAWQHITDAGFVDIHSPIDVTRARLYGFVLCWLAHDFCAASFGEDSGPELYWSEWIESWHISPLDALVIGTESKPCGDALSDALVFQTEDMSDFDSEFDCEVGENESDLAARVCTLAAMRLRPKLVSALVLSFGNKSSLFASLYGACIDWEQVAAYQRDSLEDEIERIEDQLEDEGRPDIIRKLQSDLEAFRQASKPESLTQFARDQARHAALNDPVYIGDEETSYRLKGHEWCSEGCWVVLSGIPSVQREKL
jgi:hypothetical protein